MKHLIYFTIAIHAFLGSGCASQALLVGNEYMRVSTLNENFDVSARLGKPPVKIDRKEGAVRFSVSSPGVPDRVLVIVAPNFVDGEMKPPGLVDGKGPSTIETVGKYGDYINRVLRSHRHLLRGELEDAEQNLIEIDRFYGRTYATLLLRGNIAHINGDKFNAQRFFRLAKDLYPEGEQLKGVAIE